MGAVTAFFMIPFLAVIVFFGSVFGSVTGADKAKVELPYDEEKGLVWTCEENADWFSVTDVKIKGDNQVFTIEGDSFMDTEYRSYFEPEEVIFTAANNEQVTYMAVRYEGAFSLNANWIVKLYSPEEYGVIEYTPKADMPVEGAVWFGGSDENIYDIEGADGEAEFKLVYIPEYVTGDLPQDNSESFAERLQDTYQYIYATLPFYLPPSLQDNVPEEFINTKFSTYLLYAVKGERGIHDYRERIILDVEIENGEAKILKETHEYYVDNEWSETKTAN